MLAIELIRRGTSAVTCVAGIVILSCTLPTMALASGTPPDSTTLNGTWRWIRSVGGMLGGKETPAACGCERILRFNPEGTYEYVERDSANEYLLCAGPLTIHRFERTSENTDVGGVDSLAWLTLGNWWVSYEHNMLIWFVNDDTLGAYPGSPTTGVSDALTHWFARARGVDKDDEHKAKRSRLPLGARPPRASMDWLPEEGEFVYYEDAPRPIHEVPVVYPISAGQAPVEGTVILHVLVGTDGLVKSVKIARGVTGVNEAAMTAVKQWIFKPALSNNKPVAVWIEVPVHFPR